MIYWRFRVYIALQGNKGYILFPCELQGEALLHMYRRIEDSPCICEPTIHVRNLLWVHYNNTQTKLCRIFLAWFTSSVEMLKENQQEPYCGHTIGLVTRGCCAFTTPSLLIFS